MTPPPRFNEPTIPGQVLVGDPAQTRFYFKGDYLLWWTKNDKAPPLVTGGSATNENFPRADGALGNPDTAVLQNGTLSRNPFSGARLTVGYALDACSDKFIEFSGFFLGQQDYNFSATTAQNAVLSRPFFAVNSAAEPGVRARNRPDRVCGRQHLGSRPVGALGSRAEPGVQLVPGV